LGIVISSVIISNPSSETVPAAFVKNVLGLKTNSNSIFCLCMAHVGKYGLFGLFVSYSSLSYFLEKKNGMGINNLDFNFF